MARPELKHSIIAPAWMVFVILIIAPTTANCDSFTQKTEPGHDSDIASSVTTAKSTSDTRTTGHHTTTTNPVSSTNISPKLSDHFSFDTRSIGALSPLTTLSPQYHIDVCSRDNRTNFLLLTDTVVLHTYAYNTSCHVTVDMDTAHAHNNSTGIVVNMLDSGRSNNVYSYFYVETLERHDPVCPTSNYVSLEIDSTTPCRFQIVGRKFRLVFHNTDLTLEIHAVDNLTATADCVKKQSLPAADQAHIGASIAECNATMYANKMHYTTKSEMHSIYFQRLRFFVARFTTKCTVSCTCSLAHREWLSKCEHAINHTHHDELIVYRHSFDGLSFENTGLHFVQPDAFQGLANVRMLQLQQNNIRMLPKTICGDLPNLQMLNVSANLIANLTRGIFQGRCAAQLLYLDLGNNRLTSLTPDIFPPLSRLIDVMRPTGNNKSAMIPVDAFHSLGNSTLLRSEDNSLSNLIVDPFDSMVKLVWLNLENNHLSKLPLDLFHKLPNLKRLNLKNNDLSRLPSNAFHPLGRLRRLDLENTSLASLPVDIFHPFADDLHRLVKLYLADNVLTTLPDGIFEGLGDLKVLYLSGNHLSSLATGVFRSLHNLTYLALDNNNLSSLPTGIFDKLHNLNLLFLNGNRLTALPTGLFDALGELVILSLRDNDLGYVDLHCASDNHTMNASDIFLSLASLQTLDLTNNRLTLLCERSFWMMEKLETLSLSTNYLRDIPFKAFQYLKHLIYLNISDNALISLPAFNAQAELNILDISMNNLTKLEPDTFSGLTNLTYMSVRQNFLINLLTEIFAPMDNLIFLDLGQNLLTTLPNRVLHNQKNLCSLKLDYNSIGDLQPNSLSGLENLKILDISCNRLHTISGEVLRGLGQITSIDMSHNLIQTIDPGAFSHSKSLQTINLKYNEMLRVTSDSFQASQKLSIYVGEYSTCCFIKENHNHSCTSVKLKPEYLTCSRMLQDILLRICVWVIGVSAIVFNAVAIFTIYTRNKSRKTANKVQTLLILQLSFSDLLMGVGMLLLAFGDTYYGKYFPSYSTAWRTGPSCKLAGILSTLSSEGSVFFVTLISIDRFIGVKYPFSNRRLDTKYIHVCIGLVWLFSAVISIVPISFPIADVSNGQFSLSEVCVGIPIVRRLVSEYVTKVASVNSISVNIYDSRANYYDLERGTFAVNIEESMNNITYKISNNIGSEPAAYISIVVFVGLNLFCFTVIAFCYVQIFVCAMQSAKKSARAQARKEELRMAAKMFAIVFTDFCCWVPLCVICILAQCQIISVPADMYVWIVGLVLPINSSINPFLYTLSGYISDYREKQREKASLTRQSRPIELNTKSVH